MGFNQPSNSKLTDAVLVGATTQQQILRYGIIGAASNCALYLAYLALSFFGVGPKSASTMVYGAGVLSTFVLNRRWTFQYLGSKHDALIRYLTAYTIGYAFNLITLIIAVDKYGFPHRWVMLVLIVATACILFLLQKFWVFPTAS